MKPPRLNPEFDRAADRLSAWRKLQKQTLDDQQRQHYDKLQAEHNRQLREHAQKFHDREIELRELETSRLLRERQELSLRMLPLKKLRYSRARVMARHNVFAQHEREAQALEKKQQDERDDFLRNTEQEREKLAQETNDQKQTPEKANDNHLGRDFAAALKARAAQKSAERDGGRDRERD